MEGLQKEWRVCKKNGGFAKRMEGLQKDQQLLNEVVDFFINTFQIFLPRHVLAYGCHPQGVVSA
jgi:hypothetical protein